MKHTVKFNDLSQVILDYFKEKGVIPSNHPFGYKVSWSAQYENDKPSLEISVEVLDKDGKPV